MLDEQLKYKVAITLVEGVGAVTAKKLVAYCGGFEAIFKETPNALQKLKIPGVKGLFDAIDKEAVLERAEEEIEFMEKENIVPLSFLDKKYPARLKHCEDSPVMIYAQGNCNFNVPKVVSIVGTRKCTSYGKKFCEELVEGLAKHNVLVVSGLAFGIDICAHKAALDAGLNTVGVLAHGLDILYPKQHQSTANRMMHEGGVVTEHCSKTNFHPSNFPERNRIVAGMADAVVVIESAAKGGSLITANIANTYNRDVFAYPGRVNDKASAGCNRLIKSHKAALIESIKDVEYVMGWKREKEKSKRVQKQLFVDLNTEEKSLIAVLQQKGEVAVDKLSLEAKIPVSKTSAILLDLEFKGLIRSLPGKVYCLN